VKRMKALFGTLFLLAGCGASSIPNTDVEDTSPNREIIAVCERYRKAVEQLNKAALLRMASPRYFEDSGTPAGEDDYDYAGLRDVLENRFQKVRTMRYEIHYHRIQNDRHDPGKIHVDYTYRASFQLETDTGDKWYRRVADNRLTLERVGDEWRIVSGM
jgi:hypothetical protein